MDGRGQPGLGGPVSASREEPHTPSQRGAGQMPSTPKRPLVSSMKRVEIANLDASARRVVDAYTICPVRSMAPARESIDARLDRDVRRLDRPT